MRLELLLIPWFGIMIVATLSAWRYTWGLPRSEVPQLTPRAVIIVPIKGRSEQDAVFFRALRSQNYPDYRIVAALESEDDPAFPLLTNELAHDGAPVEVCIAGLAVQSGQKVHNLLAALDRVRPDDSIVAFIDADTSPGPEWLPRLISEIVDSGHAAVTGYRWIVPTDDRLSSAVVSVANTSIVTLPRLALVMNACWGGTTAMRRSTLEQIGIRRYWEGALVDDLQMTRALRDHGVRIFSRRQSLLLSPVAMTWRQAFAFGRRQYQIVLTHEPGLWLLAAIITLIPALSCVFAFWLVAQGSIVAAALLIVSVFLGEIRTRCRKRIVRAMWRQEGNVSRARLWAVDRWLKPLWWGFHAVCVFSALGSRRVHWAGVDYIVHHRQDIQVIRPRMDKEVR
ncbi:MAG: hypothetical protein NVSMB26_04480 [Beijerinckiaceae bacterium]